VGMENESEYGMERGRMGLREGMLETEGKTWVKGFGESREMRWR
jgi:hypothetical protein